MIRRVLEGGDRCAQAAAFRSQAATPSIRSSRSTASWRSGLCIPTRSRETAREARRCADSRKAASASASFRRAQERKALRVRLRADGPVDDKLNTPGEALAAMPQVMRSPTSRLRARRATCWRSAAAQARRRSGVRFAAGDLGSARLGEGRRHRRLRSQLEGLRPRSRVQRRGMETLLPIRRRAAAARRLRAGSSERGAERFQTRGGFRSRPAGMSSGTPRITVRGKPGFPIST